MRVQALFWVGVLSGEDVRRAPPSHVASLFDCYADNFDSHLVKALQYRTPTLLMDAITAAADQVHPPTDFFFLWTVTTSTTGRLYMSRGCPLPFGVGGGGQPLPSAGGPVSALAHARTYGVSSATVAL